MAILGLILGLLPASRVKNCLMTWFVPGWRVASDAVVGPCLIWGVRTLEIGPGAYVGFGNAFRTLRHVSVGSGAEIGQLNWFSAAGRYAGSMEWPLAGALELADRAGITSRHYIDCSGGLAVEELAIIGGVRSTVITHGIDTGGTTVRAAPVRVGTGSILNSGCIVAAGVTVGTRCIVGAGSVLTRDLTEPETLYGGVPARSIRSLAGSPMFDRDSSRFMPRQSGTAAGEDPSRQKLRRRGVIR